MPGRVHLKYVVEKACRRDADGREYLDLDRFEALGIGDRIDAYLRLVYPNARQVKHIAAVVRASGDTVSALLGQLATQHRVKRVERGQWRSITRRRKAPRPSHNLPIYLEDTPS